MNVPIAAAILVLSLFGGVQQEKPVSQEKPSSQDMSSCPMHQQHQAAAQDEHHQGVVERSDRAMGFSHETTTHHFRLYADGGAIEAEAKDTQDAASRDAIRSHFTHIAKSFAAGDFSIPMLIHAEDPPGTETMKRLREAIQYNLESTARGARIRIMTKAPEAVQAVHKFLRFQIAEHQTGDSTEVTKVP